MREEAGDDEGWNKTLEDEFEESLGRISISGDNTHDNLRLMGAFIAKTRWDLMVKDEDRKTLIEMTAAPGFKERLHKIILCDRRYIQQYCENIGNGNVMIRRLLISTGYIYDYPSVFLICRNEKGSKLFDALQEKSSRDEYGTVLGRLVFTKVRGVSRM